MHTVHLLSRLLHQKARLEAVLPDILLLLHVETLYIWRRNCYVNPRSSSFNLFENPGNAFWFFGLLLQWLDAKYIRTEQSTLWLSLSFTCTPRHVLHSWRCSWCAARPLPPSGPHLFISFAPQLSLSLVTRGVKGKIGHENSSAAPGPRRVGGGGGARAGAAPSGPDEPALKLASQLTRGGLGNGSWPWLPQDTVLNYTPGFKIAKVSLWNVNENCRAAMPNVCNAASALYACKTLEIKPTHAQTNSKTHFSPGQNVYACRCTFQCFSHPS